MILKKAIVGTTLLMLGFAGLGLAYSAIGAGSRVVGEEPQAATRSNAPHDTVAAAERIRGETRSVLEKALALVPSIEHLDQRVWLLCEIVHANPGGARRRGQRDLESGGRDGPRDRERTPGGRRRRGPARARDVRKAVELVNPLPLNRDYGLDHVASAMARNGDFAGAPRVATAIDNEPYKSEAFRSIAVAQVEAGDVDGAFTTIARVADDDAKAWVLAAVAARQHRANDPAAAGSLERLRTTADEIVRSANEKALMALRWSSSLGSRKSWPTPGPPTTRGRSPARSSTPRGRHRSDEHRDRPGWSRRDRGRLENGGRNSRRRPERRGPEERRGRPGRGEQSRSLADAGRPDRAGELAR